MTMLRKLKDLLNYQYKWFFFILVGFSLAISIVEIASLSSVMPFISIAMDFSLIESNDYYRMVYQWTGFNSTVDFVILFGVFLVIFYFLRGGLVLLFFNSLARFTYGLHSLIVQNLFSRYMAITYRDFTSKNTGILTKTIITESYLVSMIVSDALLLMSELFIMVLFYLLMLVVEWKITLVMTGALLMMTFLMTRSISRRISTVGVARERAQSRLYEHLNSEFGNFKINKLSWRQNNIHRKIKKISFDFRDANVTNTTFTHFPRIFLETGSFGLIITLLLYLIWTKQGNVAFILPTISLFVIALFRLLPSINRIITSYNTILYNHRALDVVHTDSFCEGENLGDDTIHFRKRIELFGVNFSYLNQNSVIKDANIVINKGEKVAFVGESGSGKSTLVDLIIGLHSPNDGEIKVDGTLLDTNNIRDWRSKIGYVPQHIYLFDGTVAENVLFGREYDEPRLVKSLKKANIYNFLEDKEGIHTKVGENGIQLSGGQKQRIAIARALYGDPEVLVFDEATSALDSATEDKILNEIYEMSWNETLIVVAHRIATVDRCNRHFQLKNGRINELTSLMNLGRNYG